MNKMKRNIKIISLTVTFIVSFFSVLSITNSAVLTDPDDILLLSTPAPDTYVKGTVPVTFRLYDDDQSDIELQANVYDPGSCNSINYGRIGNAITYRSNPSMSNTFLWDTTKTNVTSNLVDGEYCIKLCSSMLLETSPYSACTSRVVKIVNNNTPPTITSYPSRLEYLEGEIFSYDVNATDPDGDVLTYRFVNGADFLTIDNQTGIIQSSQLSTLGNPGLIYTITVGVSDGVNEEVYQTFELTIMKPKPPVIEEPAPVIPEPEVPGGKNPEEDIDSTVLAFEIPGINTTFTDELNLIRWGGVDSELESIQLEYSNNQSDWYEIGDEFSPDRTYYLWDVSEVENGDYYIRLVMNDSTGKTTYLMSNKFSINLSNKENPDESNNNDNEVDSEPMVVNVSPYNEEIINIQNPTISGDFIPSELETMLPDTFQIELDGTNITELCIVSTDRFECSLESNLEEGAHIVSTSVIDTSEQQAFNEWTFEVELSNTDTESDVDEDIIIIFGREVPRSGLIMIAIVICLGAILLFIPWILYSIWSRNSRSSSDRGSSYPPPNSNRNYLDDYSLDSLGTLNNYGSTDNTIQPYDSNITYDVNNTNNTSASDFKFTPDPTLSSQLDQYNDPNNSNYIEPDKS